MIPMDLRRYVAADGSEPFTDWLRELRDRSARARIETRLARVALGNFGDSKPVGDEIDFYSASVETHEHALADAALTPGKHTLKLDCIGKNPASKGWKLGVDSIRLRHRWDKKRPPLAPAKK